MTDGLVAALARAQMAFPPIVKSHTNPAFKGSQYADVADVLAAVRPVLAAEGIVVSQSTRIGDEGGVVLETTLEFSGDEDNEMRSEFPLYVAGLTAQQVGSLLTYHRRYQLCAILGVHPVGDDDDGNLAATAAPSAAEDDDLADLRRIAQADIAALTAAEKDVVATWIRNHKVPSLKRPGATLDQLVALAAFIGNLPEEPFEVRAPSEADQGERDNAAGGSTRATDDERPLFEPVVASSAADDSGSARKQRDAIARGSRDEKN